MELLSGACPNGAFVSAVTQATAMHCDPECKNMELSLFASSLLPALLSLRAEGEN